MAEAKALLAKLKDAYAKKDMATGKTLLGSIKVCGSFAMFCEF